MMTFRSIAASDCPVLASWFGDPELSRRVSAPDATWFRHVTAGNDARAWVGLDEDGTIVCEVQVDREPDGAGFIDYYIRPDLRGRGLGSRMLAAFIAMSSAATTGAWSRRSRRITRRASPAPAAAASSNSAGSRNRE